MKFQIGQKVRVINWDDSEGQRRSTIPAHLQGEEVILIERDGNAYLCQPTNLKGIVGHSTDSFRQSRYNNGEWWLEEEYLSDVHQNDEAPCARRAKIALTGVK